MRGHRRPSGARAAGPSGLPGGGGSALGGGVVAGGDDLVEAFVPPVAALDGASTDLSGGAGVAVDDLTDAGHRLGIDPGVLQGAAESVPVVQEPFTVGVHTAR